MLLLAGVNYVRKAIIKISGGRPAVWHVGRIKQQKISEPQALIFVYVSIKVAFHFHYFLALIVLDLLVKNL